jgi:hypothetical protein
MQSWVTELADEMSELKAHPLSLCRVDNRLIDMEPQKQCLPSNRWKALNDQNERIRMESLFVGEGMVSLGTQYDWSV